MIAVAVWGAAVLMAVAACATLLRMWRWVETVVLSPRPAAARAPARRTVGVSPPPPPSAGSVLPPGEAGHLVGIEAILAAMEMYRDECAERAAAERRGFS